MFNTDTLIITPKLLQMVAEIDEFKGAWQALGTLAPERLSALKQVATIESIASSTRIEGSQLTDQQVRQLLSNLDVQAFASRDEQEVAGYADVMEMVFNAWRDITLTENHIKQLHRDLLRYSDKDDRHRGEYKTSHNHVAAFDADGKTMGIVFQTASPFDTPRLMTELVSSHRVFFSISSIHLPSSVLPNWKDTRHKPSSIGAYQPPKARVNSNGNYSYVGRIKGSQELGIFNWNNEFIIAHELKHALGWHYEQQRPDRNRFVSVQNQNIQSGKNNNFNIEASSSIRTPYDFDSVMHYGRFAFSANGNPTIVPKPGQSGNARNMGQRRFLSTTDLQEIAIVYGDSSIQWCRSHPRDINIKPPAGCFYDCYTNREDAGQWVLCGSCGVPECR